MSLVPRSPKLVVKPLAALCSEDCAESELGVSRVPDLLVFLCGGALEIVSHNIFVEISLYESLDFFIFYFLEILHGPLTGV